MPKNVNLSSQNDKKPGPLSFIEQELPHLRRIQEHVERLGRQQLRLARQAQGKEQADAARAFKMSQQNLSQTELREGAETLSIGKLRRMARLLGYDVVYYLVPTRKGGPK